MPQALHSNSSMNHPPSIVGSLPSIIPHIIEDDEDKGSRSNAAEFGDDGTRSAAADFDDHSSVTSDSVHEDSLHHGHPHRHHHQHLHHHHSVVDDQIMAPPQPQPSFAATASVVSTKSYAELLEENDLLQQQLRAMRIQMKHQEEMIYHLRQLTECNDEVYGKALHLSQIKEEDLKKINSLSIGGRSSSRSSSTHSGRAGGDATSGSLLMTANLNSIDYSQIAPIVNARTLTQKLVRLAETVTRFSQSAAINEEWSLRLEQVLYLRIMESYLGSLPFGTENQHLLNTAYSDQIRRFHNTLGANFAKWYRRQTVQSLSLNPATKEYLQHMRSYVTEQMLGIVNTMLQAAAAAAAAAAATAATSPTKEGHDTEEHSLDDNDAKGNKVEEGDDMEDVQQMTTTRATHENTTTATSQPTAAVAPPTAALLDQNNLHLWNELLELCSALSLEIHGGDADVTAQIIAVGSKYDEEIMAPIGDDLKNTNIKDKAVKMVVSPLFVDEDEVVLLPARVVLE
ncbi:hypothetical protein BDF20DRAFT_861302 [Mycotypha africana]|uniref:uncharacterized protein n=1 Tax=Mycotypha africana TaxID=64632 RepID=UPI0023016B32|nr:uncharacterized protein BDF20DRAFT_861302 [Mycotypha africana]KAI8984708.1 hypothetical protein BDF20DRAFT_861302 [Mycotypha africana]